MARAPRGARATRFVLRDSTPLVAFGLAAAVGLVLVVDPLVVGQPAVFGYTLPLVAGTLGVLWLLLAHPHVRYDEQAVTVTGIGRVHRLPWSHITAIRQQLSLAFVLDDGRSILASGVTAPRDRGLVMSAITRGRLGAGAAAAHSNADALRSFRETSARRVGVDEPVVSSWDVVPLVVVGVLVIAAVCDAAILLLR